LPMVTILVDEKPGVQAIANTAPPGVGYLCGGYGVSEGRACEVAHLAH